MANKCVNMTIDKQVAHVELSRGDKMNALNEQMFEELPRVAQQIRENKSIRAVVISGRGGNFCAGLDKSNFTKIFEAVTANDGKPSPGLMNLTERTNGIANRVQDAVWQWHTLPVPVIAAVEGVAFGGGFQIALAADMRYVAADSRFSILEIKWGLVPDMGGTQLMRHLASEDIVRELSYTGRIFSAEQAREYNFVTRICDDPLAEATQLAHEIASKNPDAIRASKRLFNAANYQTEAEGLLMESQEQDHIIGSANQVEAVMAELEQRAPVFRDEQ